MKLIIRKRYLKRLDSCRGTPDIKVITGIRRCGKSKLLESFASKVQQEEPDCNIIKINFNLAEFEEMREYHRLYDYVSRRYREGANNYLMIDEVQLCDDLKRRLILSTQRKNTIFTSRDPMLFYPARI